MRRKAGFKQVKPATKAWRRGHAVTPDPRFTAKRCFTVGGARERKAVARLPSEIVEHYKIALHETVPQVFHGHHHVGYKLISAERRGHNVTLVFRRTKK